MRVTRHDMMGLLLIEPVCFADARGFFLETYKIPRYRDAGILDYFVQDNHSRSRQGVLRGLHFQIKKPQAQIVTVMRGAIFDVVVDLRPSSPTFGRSAGMRLSEDGVRQVYMAPGFAHGFCVLSDYADLHYKVSQAYDHADEGGLLWRDPKLAIEWPVADPTVSARDDAFPALQDIPRENLPQI